MDINCRTRCGNNRPRGGIIRFAWRKCQECILMAIMTESHVTSYFIENGYGIRRTHRHHPLPGSWSASGWLSLLLQYLKQIAAMIGPEESAIVWRQRDFVDAVELQSVGIARQDHPQAVLRAEFVITF